MAATRTAQGTAQDKTSGATLTVSAVSVSYGEAFIVGLGYDNAQGHPTSVAWGNRLMRRKVARDNATTGIAMSVWVIPFVKKAGQTKDVVATWPAPIGKRAMFVTSIEGSNRPGIRAGNNEPTDTGTPSTGTTDPLVSADSFALCAFVSEGPSSDAAGTPEIQDGGVFQSATAGQRDGTTGAPPISNITIQETYLDLTQADATRGRLQGATSRQWSSGIVVFSDSHKMRWGISTTDFIDVEQIFEDEVPSLDPSTLFFHYDEDDDKWVAYSITSPGTPIAEMDAGNTNGDWEAV